MPLVCMRELLDEAMHGGYAVGYFESWNMESLLAVWEAAEEERSPVILGFGAVSLDASWLEESGTGITTLASLGLTAVHGASVPVSLLFNEASSFRQIVQAIRHGFNAVMLDSVRLPFREHVAATKEVVKVAHAAGVSVEAELGELPVGVRGILEEASSALTDPEEAGVFVEETAVDALAVSIGNVHILMDGEAKIDRDRVRRIRDRVKIPLVIHGGTGFPREEVSSVIQRGVAKINVGSLLKKAYWEGLFGAQARDAKSTESYLAFGSRKDTDILSRARLRVKEKVKDLMRLYGSSGKATAEPAFSPKQ